MSELADRLFALAEQLDALGKEHQSSNVSEPLRRLRDAANEIGHSWSGSWLGYQSRVYYAGLQPTPPGAHFSIEWGFQDLSYGLDIGTRGDWEEYTLDSIRHVIFSNAGVKSLDKLEESTSR